MDTVLQNGDFAVDERGMPVAVSSYEELLARALIRLTVRKGAFVLDETLGSTLYAIRAGSAEQIRTQALAAAKEALSALPVTVEDVLVRFESGKNRLSLCFTLAAADQKKEVTVTL